MATSSDKKPGQDARERRESEIRLRDRDTLPMNPAQAEPNQGSQGFKVPRPDSAYPTASREPTRQLRGGAKSTPDAAELPSNPTTERMVASSVPPGPGFTPVTPRRTEHNAVPVLPSGLGSSGSASNGGGRTTPIVGRMDVSGQRSGGELLQAGWNGPGFSSSAGPAEPKTNWAITAPVFPTQTLRGFYGAYPGASSSSVPPAPTFSSPPTTEPTSPGPLEQAPTGQSALPPQSTEPPRSPIPPARTGMTRQGMPAVTPSMLASMRPSPLPQIESSPPPPFNPSATIVGMPALTPDPRKMPANSPTVMGLPLPSPTTASPTPERVIVRPTLSLGSPGVPGAGGIGPQSLDARLQASVAVSGHGSKSSGSWRLNLHHEKSTPVPLVRRSSPDLSSRLAGAHTTLGIGSIQNVAPSHVSPQNYGALGSGNPSGFAASRGAPSMIAINQFQVVERLAQGGTGSVYLATRNASEHYALKVLRRENLGSEESQASLRREAELLSELTHPNVVRLFDVGSEGGEPFLVMEYIDGLSLSELLSYPLRAPLSVGITIVRDALRALSYIHCLERGPHSRGIIHGDVSPQNLLVGSDGRARLIDFGVAREPGLPARDSVVRCKPRYASPELLAGDPLGAESDLFAVGAVLFHVLTGRKLFSATEQAELLTQVTTAEIPPPSSTNSGAPKAFDELCLRALQRDRTRRYQSAAEMLHALEIAASAAGLTLSEQAVSDWVLRVRRSLVQDVELGADELASLLSHRGAANRTGADHMSLAPDAPRVQGPDLSGLYVRIGIVVVLVLVAICVVVFAIAAPDRFVQFFSGGSK